MADEIKETARAVCIFCNKPFEYTSRMADKAGKDILTQSILACSSCRTPTVPGSVGAGE